MAENSGETPTPLYRYRFGSVEFDEARATLRVGGLTVDVQRKPLEILALLLRHAGELVTHAELRAAIWGGRPTVENVIASAITKLRIALGDDNATRVVNLPRVGYRFEGTLERTAVGRIVVSGLNLEVGRDVPAREAFVFVKMLDRTLGGEVWLAQHKLTGELRVYKFCADGERLRSLKREAVLTRVLRESFGDRPDFVPVLGWNFESSPFFLETAFSGQNLREWSVDFHHLAELPRQQRLDLFLQIADAVAAAHSVGVLHKDLKPTNVLIMAQGTGWRVRLGDFGSGRLLDPERLAELGITRLDMTLTRGANDATSGTPLYIAPELLAGQPPTVQSDLYALGILLYQILVGDLNKPLVPGWELDIDDALLRDDIGAAAAGSPERRLGSVQEFAQRLRTLDMRRAAQTRQRAAEAQKDAAERALARAAVRRPWILAAGSLLSAALAVSVWSYVSVHRSKQALERQYAVVDAVNRFVTRDLIGASNPAISGRADVTVLEAVRGAAPKIDQEVGADAPLVRGALHRALQQAFSELSDYPSSIVEGRKAVDAYSNEDPPQQAKLIDAKLALALDQIQLSQFKEAGQTVQGLDTELATAGLRGSESEARYWRVMAWLTGAQFQLDAALTDDSRAWSLLQSLAHPSDDLVEAVEFELGDAFTMVGRYPEAEAHFRAVIDHRARRLGADNAMTLYLNVGLANALSYEKRYPEAITVLTRSIPGIEASLGTEHRKSLTANSVLAQVYFDEGDYSKAANTWMRIYQSLHARYGDTSEAITTLDNAATALHHSGQFRDAEASYRHALAAARPLFREDGPVTQLIRYHLASCLLDQHRPRESAVLVVGLSAAALNLAEQNPGWADILSQQANQIKSQR